jgi:hypothetical protein
MALRHFYPSLEMDGKAINTANSRLLQAKEGVRGTVMQARGWGQEALVLEFR